MLDGVLFELSNISHLMNTEKETVQHLSHDLMFVVSEKMIQIEYIFVTEYKRLPVL